MPSDDFNEFIDEAAQAIKRAVGPFSGLLNPQSSQRDKTKIVELEARVARQDRLLDQQIDGVNEAKRKQREAELERDALREQIDRVGGEPTDLEKKKLFKIADLVEQAHPDKHHVGSDMQAFHFSSFFREVQAVMRSY